MENAQGGSHKNENQGMPFEMVLHVHRTLKTALARRMATTTIANNDQGKTNKELGFSKN